jgi:hypothetical protein
MCRRLLEDDQVDRPDVHGERSSQPTGPNSQLLDHPDPRPSLAQDESVAQDTPKTKRRNAACLSQDKRLEEKLAHDTRALRASDHQEIKPTARLRSAWPPDSGDHTGGATPVPIPNTAVKPAGPMIVPQARKSVIAGSISTAE